MEQWQLLPKMKGSMVSLMRVLDRLVEHKMKVKKRKTSA